MKYKVFGKSGLRVSELCLGTMTFGKEFEWGSSKADSKLVFDTFIKAGGNFIDTANYYTNGTSERFLGEWIAPIRDFVVLATKYSLLTDPKNPNAGGNHRKNMVQSVEASLKRLKTDYIDLYWVHAWDFTVPAEEMMRALDDLVSSGKVLHVAVSNAPAWVVAKCNTLAQIRGWSPFVGAQLEYSLIERASDRELRPMCENFDMGVVAWSPLAMGLLTGKYTDSKVEKESRFAINDYFRTNYMTKRNLSIAKVLDEVASQLGRPPAQVALAWMMEKNIIPIIGAKNKEQLESNLGCTDLTLDKEQIEKLEEASQIDLGYPHTFLQREGIQKVLIKENSDE